MALALRLPRRVYRKLPRRLPLALQHPLYMLRFDGVNDYVEIPHSDSLNLNVLTVMCWFRSVYAGVWFRTIVAKYGYTYISNFWGLGWVAANVIGFVIRDATGVVNIARAGAGEGLDGRWHFLAGVASDTRLQFWMDGVLKQEVDRTAGDIRNTRPVTVGRHLDTYVPEDVSVIHIYNRALSRSEIEYNMYNPLNPVREGLVLFLPLIEGSGTIVKDYSGFGNNGTVYGGAGWAELAEYELLAEAGL